MFGGTADPHYNGRYIAKRGDIVFASINYRVSAFGYLCLDDYGKEFAGSGNNSVRDQLLALRWIKRNIAAFGGDPDNITIMGESAGSASVLILMSLPQAKGLFSKVIAESGGLNLIRSHERAKAVTADFLDFAGVRDVAGLRSLSSDQLLAAFEKQLKSAGLEADLLYAPVIDGIVIAEDPLAAVAKGAASGITLLTGTNLDEYRYWINYARYLDYVPLRLALFLSPAAKKKILGHEEKVMDFYDKSYPDAHWADNTFLFVTDMMFLIPPYPGCRGTVPARGGLHVQVRLEIPSQSLPRGLPCDGTALCPQDLRLPQKLLYRRPQPSPAPVRCCPGRLGRLCENRRSQHRQPPSLACLYRSIPVPP